MDGHDLSRPLKLTFAGPSRNWTDAIPIGNGRLGATIWGGVSSETLNINGKCKTTSFLFVLETKTPPFDFPFISSLLCCVIIYSVDVLVINEALQSLLCQMTRVSRNHLLT